MSTEQTNVKAAIEGSVSGYGFVLQDSATDTTAGGDQVIPVSGNYVYSCEGTIDTATPSLYVKRQGSSNAHVVHDIVNSQDATLTVEGGSCVVSLGENDVVYSQSTVVGGSPDYNTRLSLVDN